MPHSTHILLHFFALASLSITIICYTGRSCTLSHFGYMGYYSDVIDYAHELMPRRFSSWRYVDVSCLSIRFFAVIITFPAVIFSQPVLPARYRPYSRS